MKTPATFIRLAFLSVIFGVALLGSVQPAAAFSLNPIKAVKSIAHAAVNTGKSLVNTTVNVAKGIGKEASKVGQVAGQLTTTALSKAFAVGNQIARASGNGLLSGGSFVGGGLLKITSAKHPFEALAKVAALGTPLAPFIAGKGVLDSVKHPPSVRDFVPAPPSFAGLAKGTTTIRMSAPNSVFGPPKLVAVARPLGDPRHPLDQLKRTMNEPKRNFEQKFEQFRRIGEEPKQRKIEEVKRTTEQPKQNELKRAIEEPRRKLDEPKRTVEEPKQRKIEEVKRTTEDPKRNELKRTLEEPKRKPDEVRRKMDDPKLLTAAPKPMMTTPKPMMTPTPPPMSGGYSGGLRH